MDVICEHNYFRPENFISKEKTYQCFICFAVYKHNGSLHHHLRRVHKVTNIGAKNIKCREERCNERFNRLSELEVHLNKKHLIKIEKQKLIFGSLEEFKIWKTELEKESEYVAYTPGSSRNTLYFKCSRSGVYKKNLAHGTRKRKLKAQGSKKLGAHCISRMIVQINDSNGTVSVVFCKTHYGHDLELAHVNLCKIEKDKIAASLAQGVPVDAILDGVRNSVKDNEIKRIHLLTKKDIQNIEKSYGLKKDVERHKSDLMSVDAWTKEMEASGQSPVIIYKNQGEAQNEDFLLGLMTDSQANILMKFGNGGIICMDRAPGKNPHNLTLITVMVVDSSHEGFPVAFLYTNKDDTKSVTEFLSSIRNMTGQIDAAVFVSDDIDQYSDSWRSVMGGSFKKLLSSWHVDRAWRKYLNLIKNKQKQAEIYKLLKLIQCETSMDIFADLHFKFIKKLCMDSELHGFCKYFEKNYSQRTEMWAYCHWVGSKINTNMFLESIHKVIKQVYMKVMKIRRLDRSIDLLMKFVKNKEFERLIRLHKGRASTKITDMESKQSKELKFS